MVESKRPWSCMSIQNLVQRVLDINVSTNAQSPICSGHNQQDIIQCSTFTGKTRCKRVIYTKILQVEPSPRRFKYFESWDRSYVLDISIPRLSQGLSISVYLNHLKTMQGIVRLFLNFTTYRVTMPWALKIPDIQSQKCTGATWAREHLVQLEALHVRKPHNVFSNISRFIFVPNVIFTYAAWRFLWDRRRSKR